MECPPDKCSTKRAAGNSMARSSGAPSVNRDYLSVSGKFASELRKARTRSRELHQTAPNPGHCDRPSKCAAPAKPCAQVLKSNLPASSDNSSCERSKASCRTRNLSPCSSRGCAAAAAPAAGDQRARMPTAPDACRGQLQSATRDNCAKAIASTLRKARHSPLNDTENCGLPGLVKPKGNNALQELEDKVDFLNCQAQQLLKQLKREQVERERMAEQYDEALEEIRRLRDRERHPNADAEARLRRLECERDEATAKMRSAQVDSEESKCKLDRLTDDSCRERQRLLDKIATLEQRMHGREAEQEELSRRHTRTLETLAKMETQADEQKTKILVLEDQKQELLKQLDNLGLFVKDLEASSKQLHERLDEKRYEVHAARERTTELEELLGRVDQHLLHERERSVQLQNDAYQAQLSGQQLRTELRNLLKKKPKTDCK
ncbi:paramyosin, long form-like [Paramacrobiotus metropolitanus]|uniref:paramyosin, long form-like n=1 Tax=Paramacrobiotus metropolitanus TaxID=2943436 RepID=UPI0024460AD3|nr:paramyosin, long form-like [Paramacrobiotus metropolitanus]